MLSLGGLRSPSLAAPSPLTLLLSRGMRRKQPKQGKPPILPPAKKVLYRVVHPEWEKPADVQELLWRRLTYNNALQSMRELFRAEVETRAAAGSGVEHMKEAEEEEFNRILEEAADRKKQRRAAREEREQEEWRETRNEILEDIQRGLEKQKEEAAASAAKVRDAIARSETFVTKEKLEERILAALEAPIVYDYAIDRAGRKYSEEAPPAKYLEGTPTRQRRRIYEKTLEPTFDTAREAEEKQPVAAVGGEQSG